MVVYFNDKINLQIIIRLKLNITLWVTKDSALYFPRSLAMCRQVKNLKLLFLAFYSRHLCEIVVLFDNFL
jgi:hypothetical protein